MGPTCREADIDSLGADPLGRIHDDLDAPMAMVARHAGAGVLVGVASSRCCRRRALPLNRELRRAREQRRAARAHRAWAVLFALVALAGCGPEGGTPPQPPKLSFASSAQELGTVAQGEPFQHRFEFRNDGGSALVIHNVKTACDCAAALAQESVVAPGASGSIEVRCNSDHSHGRVQRTVTVYSNDPARPVLTLTIGGEVDPDAVADPPALYLGHVRRGQRSENEARLFARAPEALRLATGGGAVLDASLQPADSAGTARSLAVAIKPDAPLGRFSETVRVATNSPKHPLLKIDVVGFVDGDLVVSPRALSFGRVTQGDAAADTLLVENRGQAPVHVTAASVAGSSARAEVQTIEEGRRYEVRVVLNTSLPPGRLNDRVEIRTDHPEQPLLRVPVSGQIRKRAP